jgi:hypothetical protein
MGFLSKGMKMITRDRIERDLWFEIVEEKLRAHDQIRSKNERKQNPNLIVMERFNVSFSFSR